jgi:2-keto-4-pentenoate hydratase/2-oxohepta-3-ene-1,7-dioic acid hydratase in catechol pathway
MKLVTFRRAGAFGVGALTEQGAVVDLKEASGATDMIDLIGCFSTRRPAIEQAIKAGSTYAAGSFEIVAPIPQPRRNIFCVGKNYHDHALEFGASGFDSGSVGGSEIPDHPIIFTKPPSAVIGPGDAIDSALDPTQSVDYEAEIAVVIGKTGRVRDGDDPMSFVFGYTIVNDVTSRELQKLHKQWVLGKGIDTFAPMGPAIVTADAVGNIKDMSLRLWVNGELRQQAAVGALIFDIPTLVRTIGRSISLQAGDIIATGTPLGVGIGFKPPRYLRKGDRVRIEASSIGVLENPVA